MTEPTLSCPFCGEDDFDLIGLKMHLIRGWCEAFDNLKLPPRVIDLMKKEKLTL
jgi:hypothetical protein